MAQLYGWRPQGTSLLQRLTAEPDAEDVLGSYYPKEGQTLSQADAKAIAKALTEALEDIPDFDAVEHKTEYQVRDGQKIRVVKPNMKFNLFEAFSGDNKKLVRDFIWFCKQGEFEVW